MPTTEEPVPKRPGRKLSKKAKPLNRLPSSHVPERFKYGEDVNEDVTAPARAGASAPQYMNQSIFSMIAAAGSRTDFNARFDESSDSADEDEPDRDTASGQAETFSSAGKQAKALSKPPAELDSPQPKLSKEEKGYKRKSSEQRLLKSLPKLLLHSTKEGKRPETPPSANAGDKYPLGYRGENKHLTPRDAPMMSRMLEAEAEAEAELGASDLSPDVMMRLEKADKTRDRADSSPASLLATRLMEIFGFAEPESVVAEYPCWLLQTVLLQGYLYITRRHICFYAYLPKKSASVVKTGYLYKRGRQNPKSSRYWFTLKGDVLSYYSNPSDLFFPAGNIDLRYGISASLTEEKDKQKTTKEFSLTTDHRTYHFKADSHTSAKEWVKNLQKVIFRSHNDGDSVKISLPVENVIDIEESPVVDFVETLKVRVVESGDSYAIDEVCAKLASSLDLLTMPSTSSPSSVLARTHSVC
jgi:sterol 3beta-glucosyltransferase